jgi:hypothetical protein
MRKFTRFVGALVIAAMMSLAVSPVAAQAVVTEGSVQDGESICALIYAALIFIGELPDSRGIQKLEAKLQELAMQYNCVTPAP